MDVADYEGNDAELFWATHDDVDEGTRAAIERLRPARPMWISASDAAARERWSVAWRIAAAYAVLCDVDDRERDIRVFVWAAARDIYRSALTTPLRVA
jgi:hypothetical protein